MKHGRVVDVIKGLLGGGRNDFAWPYSRLSGMAETLKHRLHKETLAHMIAAIICES